MQEMWRPVFGYETYLEVSNLGRVRSLPSVRHSFRNGKPNSQRKRGKILSPWRAKHGYLTVAPKFGKRRIKLLVHRLVARAFVDGYFDGAEVNHIDHCKDNCAATNLEWLTKAEHTRQHWADGIHNRRGENHPGHKLTNADVAAIRARLHMGERPSSLASEYEVSDALIYAIVSGRRRRSG